MDLFGNQFHIFAGKSKGKGYTGNRNVTTGVSLWESKKKKERVDENAEAGYPALGIKGGTAAAKATQKKLKKEKPNDPISKTTVKAPWTKMTVPGDVAIGVKNQGTVYTAQGDDSDYTRQRQVSYGSETKSIKDHMERGRLDLIGEVSDAKVKGALAAAQVRVRQMKKHSNEQHPGGKVDGRFDADSQHVKQGGRNMQNRKAILQTSKRHVGRKEGQIERVTAMLAARKARRKSGKPGDWQGAGQASTDKEVQTAVIKAAGTQRNKSVVGDVEQSQKAEKGRKDSQAKRQGARSEAGVHYNIHTK